MMRPIFMATNKPWPFYDRCPAVRWEFVQLDLVLLDHSHHIFQFSLFKTLCLI